MYVINVTHHCYSWMSDLWWPIPHPTPLTATKQHVVNSLSVCLSVCVQVYNVDSWARFTVAWFMGVGFWTFMRHPFNCMLQESGLVERERENSFRHGLCLNFSLVFALSQMHTYVCIILVFSVTFMGSCLQGSLFWNRKWMAGCKVYYGYVRMSQENASSNLDITMDDRLMAAITWTRSPELGGKAINM